MDSEMKISNQGAKMELSSPPEAMSSDPTEVSVVIPCLNEALSIGICIDKALAVFRTAGVRGEVVVADNGSTDGSIEIAREHGARVVRVEARGYGNALRKGIGEARGKFIIMGDADDSYDFSEVPRFLGKWREGFELVLGNRFQGEIKPGAMPWLHKHFGNPAITWMLDSLFHGTIGDAYCGMRGFSKALYERADLRCTGMEFALELIIKATKLGASITEIPITLWPDKRGRAPHLRTFHDGWRSLRFMLLYAPNWLFLFPGTTLFLLGFAIVVWLLPGPRQVGRAVLDLHTMLFGMMFALTGTQIISIGLFAKVYSFTERFSRSPHSLEYWLRRVSLELGLIIGALMMLTGGSGAIWVLRKWIASGFGPLYDVRVVIILSLCFLLGVQVIFASFFISMLGISRGTYIGDYDSR
ncbi:MAG TPA: glycosyltransferase family 2 protein [Terriglobia bacterium]|nr:glycosyltransferase family 2 protein [Terriglobia bacterium]